MNTVTMETSGSNMGIGFVVPGGWFKTSVEDIVLMDHLLRRGKGKNVEGSNGDKLSPGFMGVDLVDKRTGICLSHREPSEV